MVRPFLLCAALWLASSLLVLGATDGGAAEDPSYRVAILSVEFVMEHKFRLMEQAAAEQGVDLVWTHVDRDGEASVRRALQGARLVIVDAPREADQAAVARVAGELPGGASRPVVHINRMTPQRPLSAEGLDMALARRLSEYYLAGTATNHQRLFRFLQVLLDGGDVEAVPAPEPLPEGGIYHPHHPAQVLEAPLPYLGWWSEHHGTPWRDRVVIGLEISPSYIAEGQTRWMETMIAAIEARGAVPLVFYRTPGTVRPLSPGGGAPAEAGTSLFPNPAAPAWVAQHDPVITLEGRPLPRVLMVNNFLGGNPEGRKAWYQALGLPVLNVINYRGGALEDYLADTAGVDSFSIPFNLTTAEYIGMIDPVVLTTNEDGEMTPVPGHVEMLVDKALRLARQQDTAPAEKRLALFFWNHPPGEHNMGASNLNVPRSLEDLSRRLQAEGYRVEPVEEQALIDAIGHMLRPGWRGDGFDRLLATDLWDFLPLDDYRAWFDTLPATVRAEINGFFGPPEASYWVTEHQGQKGFIIPRLQRGNLVILPQPKRAEPGGADEHTLYHDTKVPVNHAYLATYLWVREHLGADAIIHFGTHGTQEWTPGKERGLWIHDYPNLLVGNLPVVYPYIVDNIGEAIHVKRRGRGVVVSHQTPPFSPAGLSDDFVAINDLIREYQQLDEGLVKANNRELIIEQAVRMNIHRDMDRSVADLHADFDAFLRDIEDYLEELGMSMQPLGLHSLGQRAEPDHLASTLMQMLGEPLYRAFGHDDPGALFRMDYQQLRETAPYRFVREHVVGGKPLEDERLAPLLEQGLHWLGRLDAASETEAVLAALSGLWVDPSYGGDPVRNPDALPTGRNMYGFDPARVPTRSAWEGGREAMQGLILTHQAEHGAFPEKLAFSLWSTETMRHLGMLEAQVLYALGVRPVWDRGGRVVDLELIPLDELGRARIDAVISITGLYRDQFPIVMERLNQAIALAASADEPPERNFVRANTLRVRDLLLARGLPEAQAADYALTRIFGNESGDYGTGLPDATLASDHWQEDDGQLAGIYLDRMSWAYGPDPAHWSSKAVDGDGRPVNVYAEQLRGVSAAVFSRSSNLRGLLDTDHPFEYLGGISLALQHLEGRAPQLYISNMRDPLRARLQTAERFLATELRSVYQHPNWLTEMQAEGYAGTTQLLNTINNFWGWQVMDRNVVRDDQWQAFHEIYVLDRFELGLREWFEEANPTALAQIAERMLEAVRKGYWEAAEETVRELTEVYLEIARAHDVHTPNATFSAYVEELAAGFGLAMPAAEPGAAGQSEPPAESGEAEPVQEGEVVQGRMLQEVAPAPPRAQAAPWLMTVPLLLLMAGFLHQAWKTARSPHGEGQPA
jgi:cobaltochelatase CobN